MRGDGFLFQRGPIYYAGYSVRGRSVQRSLKTDDLTVARRRFKALRKKLQAEGPPVLEPPTVNTLLDDLLVHLQVRGVQAKARSHMKAVREALGTVLADDLTTEQLERYQRDRLARGRARATVNRELEALRQAFRLATIRTPAGVSRAPHVPMLPVHNARQGFISWEQCQALLAAIADRDVADYLEWRWWTGMRPLEVQQLTWTMYDRASNTLILAPHAAKTRRARSFPIEGPLAQVFARRLAARRLDTPLIFHRESKGKPGQPVRDFRRLWKAALKLAKLPKGLLPYDLRRSALRNLIRAGVNETVAMSLSGHLTRDTFGRYNITSTADQKAALERTGRFVRGDLPKS